VRDIGPEHPNMGHDDPEAQGRGLIWIFALIVACVAGSVIGVAIGGAGPSDEDVRNQVREGILINCETDKEFRVQYRERAIVERRAILLETKANEAIIDVAEEAQQGAPTTSSIAELDDILDALNEKLHALRDRIQIIEIPGCEDIRTAVESLNGN